MQIGLQFMRDSLELHRFKKCDVTLTTSTYHDVHENEFEYKKKKLGKRIKPKILPTDLTVLASERL